MIKNQISGAGCPASRFLMTVRASAASSFNPKTPFPIQLAAVYSATP
jgi:hypothetical protein